MRYSRTIELGMQPDSLGDWVRFEDYAELEAKLAAAESLGEPVAWRAVGPSYTVVVTDPARATDSRWEPLYLAPQPAGDSHHE